MSAARVFRPAGTVAARVRGRFNAGADDSGHQVRTEPHAGAGEAGHGSKRVTGQQVVADHRTIAAPQFHRASVHIAPLATTTTACGSIDGHAATTIPEMIHSPADRPMAHSLPPSACH